MNFLMYNIRGGAKAPISPQKTKFVGGHKIMFETLKNLLVEELQLNPDEITLESDLANDLGVNSIELADMIMIDLHQPNMQPLHNICKNIVYSGSKMNVKMTMINGKILYEDGKFLCCDDVEALYAECNAIKERLKDC